MALWLLIAMVAAQPGAPTPIAPPVRELTLDQALELARQNRPQLRQAQASTRAARARADQARSPLLPQLSANATYQRSTANFSARPGEVPPGIATRVVTPSWQSFDFLTFGATLNQLVFDFGQVQGRWRAAQAGAAAQADTEQATREQVDYDVRNAFFGARAAKALVAVAQETLHNQTAHLEQVQAFVEVGTRPEIDLAQSRTDVANARVQLINAQNGYATSKAQLELAMGIAQPTPYEVADESPGPLAGEDQSLALLLPEALAARPELAALASQVRAQELSLRAIQGAYGPSLGVSSATTEAGTTPSGLVWNWNAGATLSFPFFEGGLTRAQEREARANLEGVSAQLEAQRQQVRLELEQARLAVVAAKESLVATGDAVFNARERLRLAEGRYQTGVGNIIELSDAQLALTNAAGQQVRAEYTLAQARAGLQKALGRQ